MSVFSHEMMFIDKKLITVGSGVDRFHGVLHYLGKNLSGVPFLNFVSFIFGVLTVTIIISCLLIIYIAIYSFHFIGVIHLICIE